MKAKGRSAKEGSTAKKDRTSLFLAATPEEKRAFVDFLTERLLLPGVIPAEHQEAFAEAMITLFSEFSAQLKLGEPTNLTELQTRFSEVLVEPAAWMKQGHARSPEEAQSVMELTSATTQQKKAFWAALQKAGTQISAQLSEFQEEYVDEHIKFYADMASRIYGTRPESLDELGSFAAACMKSGAQVLDGLGRSGSELEQEFAKFAKLDASLSPDEQDGFKREILAGLSKFMQERTRQFVSETETAIRQAVDPATLGAVLGSVISGLARDATRAPIKLAQETVHTGVDAKLDEIQRQLAELCGAQDRLEVIQDQLAALTAANQERAQFGEVPPMPVIDETSPSKKEYTIERERLTGTLDPKLFELFHQERKERGVTVSRMLDIAFWQRYNKPLLSFEINDQAPSSSFTETDPEKGKRKPGRQRKEKK